MGLSECCSTCLLVGPFLAGFICVAPPPVDSVTYEKNLLYCQTADLYIKIYFYFIDNTVFFLNICLRVTYIFTYTNQNIP